MQESSHYVAADQASVSPTGSPALCQEDLATIAQVVKLLPRHLGTLLLTHEQAGGSETVCKELLRQLPPSSRVAWVLHPSHTLLEFVRSICHAFRIHGTPKEEGSLEALQNKLLTSIQDSRELGKSVVLVISDAHVTSAQTLNHLSFLNLDPSTGDALMHIVLLGEKSLNDRLEQQDFAVTRGTVVSHFHLGAPQQEPSPSGNQAQEPSRPSPLGISRPAALDSVWPTLSSAPATGQIHGLRPRGILIGSLIGLVLLFACVGAWVALSGLPPTPVADVPKDLVVPVATPLAEPPPTAREFVGVVRQAPTETPQEPALAPPQPMTSPTLEVTPAPPDSIPLTDRIPHLRELVDDQAMTWPQVGALWGVQLSADDKACDTALAQGVQCFRSNGLDFDDVRRFDRPAMLLLHQDGVDKWVRLLAMDATRARLGSTGREWVMALTDLKALWKGGAMATLWRLPPGQTRRVFNAGSDEPAGRWLDAQLKAQQAAGKLTPTANSYSARVRAFQSNNGLASDGRATPTTFLLVNRVAGVDEPSLRGAVR